MATENFWKVGGAAGWLQALCAAGVLILGVYAYSSWKEQEAARRRADLALDVMKNVFEITNCIHNARLGFSMEDSEPVDLNHVEVARLVKEAPDRVATCVTYFANYNVNGQLAVRLLPERVIEQMAVITKAIMDYQTAVAYLKANYSPSRVRRFSSDSGWRGQMKKSIDSAGMTYLKPVGQETGVGQETRAGDAEIELRMQAARAQLDNELMPFVVFQLPGHE